MAVAIVLTLVSYGLAHYLHKNPPGALFKEKATVKTTDKNYVPSTFDRIMLGGKIIPSQVGEANLVLMEPTNEKSRLQQSFASNVSSLIADEHNSRVNYFKFEMPDNFYFPDVIVDQQHVPFGTSKPYCLHLDWIKRQNFRQIDQYKAVAGFPMCQDAENAKVLWAPGDPKFGLNFHAFR
jgi:hypothetical protein